MVTSLSDSLGPAAYNINKEVTKTNLTTSYMKKIA